MKALNNALGNATGRLASMAVEVGVRLGLDADRVIEILRSGSASSAPMASMADRLMRDPEFAELAARLIVTETALLKTPEQSAATSLLLAACPLTVGVTDAYYDNCRPARTVTGDSGPGGVAAHAVDPDNTGRLWAVTQQLPDGA
ncbi:hypothetical protein ACJ6WF_01445 [Streptomyces sp. MMS24-I2-30]|uniref:hypothetical protein n=1 Tax=Streptomyces sp. MMS24-I2-30 TaxID=3351564 RepID=UPI003896A6C1